MTGEIMDIIIKDDMIKESKSWKKPMIIAFILSVLFPLVPIWNNISNTDVILGEIFFILIGCYFLYGYLYTYKYKIIVTNEKIVLKTLFKTIEIKIENIKTYKCKRYKKSEFYQFFILCNEKKYLINTKHREDLEKLLKEIKPNMK